MIQQDVRWGRLGVVFVGTWLFLYFVVFPILFYSGGEHPIPFWLWLVVTFFITQIVMRSCRSYWTREVKKEDDDG